MVNKTIPKKVKTALEENNIQGVVSGYTTRLEVGVAFTGWNELGNVVCVLVKRPNDPKWSVESFRPGA